MNRSPRGLNRLLILIAGLILLAAGAAAILVAAVPDFAAAWKDIGAGPLEWVRTAFATSELGTSGHSWWWIVVIAAVVVLIVLAIVIITREGRGRTGTLLHRRGSGTAGSVGLSVAVASEVLRESLAAVPAVAALRVTGYRVGDQTGLHLAVTPRRGASPEEVVILLEQRLAEWDSLFGEQLPTLITLGSGLRTAATSPRRAA